MIIPAALAYQLATCSPPNKHVNIATMAGLIRKEASVRPYTLNDNDGGGPNGKAYYFNTADEAARAANYLLAHHHRLAIGWAQISSPNMEQYGLTVEQVIEPCENLRIGEDILADDYVQAIRMHYRPGDDALFHALQLYNSGDPNGAPGYASDVMAYARTVVIAFPKPDAVVQQGRYFGAAPTLPLPTVQRLPYARPTGTPLLNSGQAAQELRARLYAEQEHRRLLAYRQQQARFARRVIPSLLQPISSRRPQHK